MCYCIKYCANYIGILHMYVAFPQRKMICETYLYTKRAEFFLYKFIHPVRPSVY